MEVKESCGEVIQKYCYTLAIAFKNEGANSGYSILRKTEIGLFSKRKTEKYACFMV